MAFKFSYTQPHKQPYYGLETSPERGNSAAKGVVVPRYSSFYDDEDGTIHIEHHDHDHDHHHVPEAHRHQRAHFVDFVELPDNTERRLVKPREEKKGGVISSIDDAADGFIKAKHRNFEARQWSTFKK